MKKSLLLALLIPGAAEAEDVSPVWNANAEWFMYAPSFVFKDVAGAAKYRFRVLDDCHVTREFVAAKPSDTLAPVWEQLPKGFVTVLLVIYCAFLATGSLFGVESLARNGV